VKGGKGKEYVRVREMKKGKKNEKKKKKK